MSLPPPPSREKDITGQAWQKWFSLLKEAVSPIATGGQALWSSISKAGSKLTDIESRSHGDLQNLNSPTAAHPTKDQLDALTGGANTNLHKHDHSLLTNINSVSYDHLTAAQKTDLTDRGTTTLHLHDFNNVTYPITNFIGTPAHVYTLQSLMDHEWSAGVVEGCALTDNGNGTISIATGVAVIRAIADVHTTLYGVNTPASLNIALTNDATNYLYLNYNAGAPVWNVTTTETTINGMDKVLAWEIHRLGNVLHYIDSRNQTVDATRKTNELHGGITRFSHDEGGTVLGSNLLALTVTAGEFHRRFEALTHVAFDTSVAGTANANVFTLWTVAAGVWTETANSKLVSTLLYNNVATGTVTLGNNKFGVSWVYIVNDSPSELHVVMGQAEYANIASARVASPPSSVPTLIAGFGSLVGFVVYEKSNTVFNNVYSAFTTAFSPSQATIHNGLSGLQGGTLNEYFHLTAAEYAALGATAITLATARQVATLRV